MSLPAPTPAQRIFVNPDRPTRLPDPIPEPAPEPLPEPDPEPLPPEPDPV